MFFSSYAIILGLVRASGLNPPVYQVRAAGTNLYMSLTVRPWHQENVSMRNKCAKAVTNNLNRSADSPAIDLQICHKDTHPSYNTSIFSIIVIN